MIRSSRFKSWLTTRHCRRLALIGVASTLVANIVLADQVTYTYDALGRVDTVTYSDGTIIDYDYDSNGNRTILDINAPVNFSIDDVAVSEGGSLLFTVTKNNSTTQIHDVTYATATGTAGTTDFTTTSGVLSFTVAETSKTISIQTTADSIYEDDEALTVNLSGATNGAAISDAQGVGTINNDDVGPAISINDVSAEEGNNLIFTVTKTGQTQKSHEVSYATADGTATAGADYTATSGTLSFTASQTSQSVIVTGIEDTSVESDETFYVNLSAATNGAGIADSQAIGTVTDNETGNSPPVAVDDSVGFLTELSSMVVSVTANDSDPDQDLLTIASVTQPSNAIVTINSSSLGTLNILSTLAGTSSFTYTISDGNGGTATATVLVVVLSGGIGPPDPPPLD